MLMLLLTNLYTPKAPSPRGLLLLLMLLLTNLYTQKPQARVAC